MVSNFMGLFLTIIACFNLLPTGAYNEKINQDNFYRYYDENSLNTKDQKLAKQNEIKRYKWMAESNIPTQNPVHGHINSEKGPAITSSLNSKERSVDFLSSQDKLLNAVSLIRQVLRSAHPTKKIRGPNKAKQSKRNKIPVTKKENLVDKVDQRIDADGNQDKVESENIERIDDGKASRSDEVNSEKQEKLKREFWETNKKNYLKKLSSGKYEIENLSSDELNNFDSAIEDSSNNLIKRENIVPNTESSTLPDSGNVDSLPSTIKSFTEPAKSFIRRHLWLKHKAMVGLNNLNKAKRFHIRKKRIGELSDYTEQFLTESKGVKRDCGDPELAKRHVNGCGRNLIK